METVPRPELENRWSRCRDLLRQHLPQAEGIIIFSRLNIYYLSGTFGNGLFWLPLEGEPVLLCRRGQERALLESSVTNIFSFQSYKEVAVILQNAASPLPKTFAVEMNALSWTLGNSFAKYFSQYEFIAGDRIMSMARAGKSAWELEILRKAGAIHGKCLLTLLPPMLHQGMSELEIAHTLSHLFFSAGHMGILRLEGFGEEAYLGHIAVGDSGNYPSVFNGPLGLRGVHAAVPHMGSPQKIWQPGEPLVIDNGFNLAGYQTDKTQMYWLGRHRTIPATLQAAYDFCLQLQDRLATRLKPGVRPSELWSLSQEAAAQSGWTEGFMGLGKNKVSFVGHGIGLAIDEYPVLAQGFDLPLEAGMVLAIEPKIGIPQVGMVGIENTYEVTPAGGKCLTGGPHEIIEIL